MHPFAPLMSKSLDLLGREMHKEGLESIECTPSESSDAPSSDRSDESLDVGNANESDGDQTILSKLQQAGSQSNVTSKSAGDQNVSHPPAKRRRRAENRPACRMNPHTKRDLGTSIVLMGEAHANGMIKAPQSTSLVHPNTSERRWDHLCCCQSSWYRPM